MPPPCHCCDRNPAVDQTLLTALVLPLALFDGGLPLRTRACRDCGAGLLVLALPGCAALAVPALIIGIVLL